MLQIKSNNWKGDTEKSKLYKIYKKINYTLRLFRWQKVRPDHSFLNFQEYLSIVPCVIMTSPNDSWRASPPKGGAWRGGEGKLFMWHSMNVTVSLQYSRSICFLSYKCIFHLCENYHMMRRKSVNLMWTTRQIMPNSKCLSNCLAFFNFYEKPCFEFRYSNVLLVIYIIILVFIFKITKKSAKNINYILPSYRSRTATNIPTKHKLRKR